MKNLPDNICLSHRSKLAKELAGWSLCDFPSRICVQRKNSEYQMNTLMMG